MCQLAEDFLLCSCDGEDLQNPDWFLERLDPNRKPLHRRGRAMMPRFNTEQQAVQEVVLAGLTRGCFDFDYTPLQGDVLRIKLAGEWLRFRCDGASWVIDRSTSLTGWRAQMVPLQDGKVG